MQIDTAITSSAAETEAFAADVAARLVPGDLVLLSGDLGSGKTTFVRGACRRLGVTTPVTSPSYVIGNLYEGEVEVAHLDLYRLTDLELSDEASLDDFLTPQRIAFVEWPHGKLTADRAPRAIVQLEHQSEDTRRLEVQWQH
ncbi:MAG: tRNA (adenosine(37)-N6)-threonylcarbamoyltransferase complex ATPase subunit type 1 TsaE [Thermoleophilaceae bacterium]|nr:tRNA (adenosine(37)-N6)-threonylcarbamoyltransferase complex ATPase subunit type 1 TsaE [Thermoleophilaceae bacterium]